MNIQYLETFYHVARLESFSAAADELNVTKGLVSRHIRLLEEELKTRLFNRTTRSVILTEAGEHLFAHAGKVFSIIQQAAQEVSDITEEASGRLRLTASVSLGSILVEEVIPRFVQQCPGVDLELNFTNQTLDFFHHKQDIALRSQSDLNTLPDNAVATRLGFTRNIVVASPDYLKSVITGNRFEEQLHNTADFFTKDSPLRRKPLRYLLNNHSQSWNKWRLVRDAAQTLTLYPGCQPDEYAKGKTLPDNADIVAGEISGNQYTSIKQLAILGFGIANLPYYFVKNEIKQQQLIHLLPDYAEALHECFIIHAPQRRLPEKIHIMKGLLLDWAWENPQYWTDTASYLKHGIS